MKTKIKLADLENPITSNVSNELSDTSLAVTAAVIVAVMIIN